MLDAIAQERTHLENDGTASVISLVVMPDHIHLLLELGSRLPLGKTIARWKAKLVPHLRVAGARWQAGYYEHRLRPNESILPVLRYLWLNPVRSGLATPGKAWPGFFCRAEEWSWFRGYADDTILEPEWLAAANLISCREQARSHSRQIPTPNAITT